MFRRGTSYTRGDVYELLEIPASGRNGDWLTGYHRHANDYYIFCTIGVPGRTGHDYSNRWDGEKLIWHGTLSSHFNQPTIRNLISGDYRVLIFYRSTDRGPFTFGGVGVAVPHANIEFPVRIDWVFDKGKIKEVVEITDVDVPAIEYKEGHRVQVLMNRYERDREARHECIRYYGVACQVCAIDFGKRYGDYGRGFIHVHHIKPISEIGENYVVDPVRDLVPLCPNCHAMIHHTNPPLSLDALRELINLP